MLSKLTVYTIGLDAPYAFGILFNNNFCRIE